MITQFFSYYKPHRRLFLIDFFSAIFVALLELAFPLAVQWFIDGLLPSGDWNRIITVSFLLLLVYLVSTFLHYIVSYLGHKLGINIETDMRRELFEHVQKQSFRFFDNTKTGHIMTRITTDLFDIGELAHHGPEDAFIAIMTILGAFGIMYTINPELALIAIVMVPLLAVVVSFSNKKMNAAWHKMYQNIADVNGRVEDSVSGSRVVKSFTNENFELRRFQEDNDQFRLAKLKAYKVMAWATSSMYMLTRLVTLVILIVGAWFTVNDKLTYGELVSFILFSNILIKPIDKISALLELYPKGMAGFSRFRALINQEPEIKDVKNAKVVDQLRGDITLHDVTFGYDAERPVLRNIDLTIHFGQTVAFVGPSGAGKTTICSLIPRFYEVNEGSISIDGLDIREMTQKSLRSQIGIVQQDVFLFTGSIRDNIAYGKLDATDEEVFKAAEKAHLTDLINSMPNGYDTQIGERGLKLSGGQKQRLAIARMFLKNPPILILDEATSALDTETERIIQQSLEELSVNRTTLIIAHRLTTIRNADQVIVMTEDGIEEQGTYENLVRQKGTFAQLHQANQV
ncbi:MULTISPECIES: ABC transporter ATP-binding protein [unclassified Sporosarcina]|uniref:ABC transporter ATP-binding protein n=1 Tax=unclassified Sporosarcina TaxID=2647733 RepID=UPI000C1709C5|nr:MULTISPECIES: ABC transporter ATP-binding protein [unclassified Sporosarcina]PID06446.1 multidrug ABC transporter ATP-binding protein [Sporosarcina sp. P30]PID09640.1 multidrug ABC transporter ATP-binding protein [Sporosarcina sp. P31]PID13218.1 multidrug ABC transporter ATP-binding protein [Sporosarcina sp. P32b]